MIKNSVPAIHKDMGSLWTPFRNKIITLLANMEKRGHPGKVIETIRTHERQEWLYAQGRTIPGKKVTWTMDSRHLVGKACDIIPSDGDWKDHEFFVILKEEAENIGLETLSQNGDWNHVQWTEAANSKKTSNVKKRSR